MDNLALSVDEPLVIEPTVRMNPLPPSRSGVAKWLARGTTFKGRHLVERRHQARAAAFQARSVSFASTARARLACEAIPP